MEAEGRIGILYLKEIWSHYQNIRSGTPSQPIEWKYLYGVFNTLGLGLEPTVRHLTMYSQSFDEFETWVEQNGRISKPAVDYFNKAVHKDGKTFQSGNPIFNEKDLNQWQEEGYVVLKQAISKEACKASVELICKSIGADLNKPDTWYQEHPLKQGIMVQLFNEEILEENRFSPRIRQAFEQMWGKSNLVVSMDRVSFNPPETETYTFPGPNLHWDVSLKQPIPYGVQGLLYLADTKEEQGAFTVIPGFHNHIEQWVDRTGSNPREIDLLRDFGDKPIAGEAGDLIIWNHCLPHGSRPNRSTLPRFVQYINYQPLDFEHQAEWL